MKFRFVLFVSLMLFHIQIFSQIGGRYTYSFLDLTTSARVGALGGKLISNNGNDIDLVYYNPALLDSGKLNQVALNYVGYFAGIKYGYVAYGHRLNNRFNLGYGIQFLNYGSFIEADENGIITGKFKAAEYAFNITASMPLSERIRIGADLRPIISNLEQYNSFGITTDWGLYYVNPEKLFQLAFVARNLGTQIKAYQNTYEAVPFELQVGFSQKLRYAPFNFSVTAHHLETWDMSVVKDETNNSDALSYEDDPKTRPLDKFANNLFRHFIFGVEFTPIRNFYFRLGYNYQRRQEMKINSRPGTVGFSWGFGLNIKMIHFNYGRATYHLAGATNLFSVAVDLNAFKSK